MSIQAVETPTELIDTGPTGKVAGGVDDWDLDVSFVEAGGSVDHLIYMTDDNCGTTCQTACSSTCGR